jgi:hypothetical protein
VAEVPVQVRDVLVVEVLVVVELLVVEVLVEADMEGAVEAVVDLMHLLCLP